MASLSCNFVLTKRFILSSCAQPNNKDGLYVLLKPPKKEKKKNNTISGDTLERAKVPPHLMGRAITEFPEETCNWSLSGPQFPAPTAIQQRYCYPKGEPEYSFRKGAALWTMYGTDGKEDDTFRLLHVYFSPKRASNKAASASPGGRAMQSNKRQPDLKLSPPRKRKKTSDSPLTCTYNRSDPAPWPQPYERRHYPQNQEYMRYPPPMYYAPVPRVASKANRRSLPAPRTSYNALHMPPPSPCRKTESYLVSPNTPSSASEKVQTANNGEVFDQAFHPLFFETNFDPLQKTGSFEASNAASTLKQPYFPVQDHTLSNVFRQHARNSNNKDKDGAGSNGGGNITKTFSKDMVDQLLEESENPFIDGDAYWNDPLFALVLKPSTEHATTTDEDSFKSFENRLRGLQLSIFEGIMAHPPSEQGPLVSIVADWARNLARSPLEIQEENESSANIKGGEAKFKNEEIPDDVKTYGV